MPAYEDLDGESQVEVLRGLLLAVADGFGIDVANAELVLHGYNTTFRVDCADRRRLAVRVNTNSKSSPGHVAAQQAWQHAIRAETDVIVPDPIRARDGRYFVEVDAPDLGARTLATAASWLAGDDLGRAMGVGHAFALGETMGQLHRQAEHWALPTGTELPVFDSPLFGDHDVMTGAVPTGTDAQTIHDSITRCGSAFRELYAEQPLIPLHADLHGGNLKWHDEHLAVFDFDDAGLGLPMLDLAIATFYLRSEGSDAEQALLEGYSSVRRLPEHGTPRSEALIAARQLLLLNSLLSANTADLRSEIESYVPVAIGRLRNWLATDRFSLVTD